MVRHSLVGRDGAGSEQWRSGHPLGSPICEQCGARRAVLIAQTSELGRLSAAAINPNLLWFGIGPMFVRWPVAGAPRLN